jgi:hypothetical protein
MIKLKSWKYRTFKATQDSETQQNKAGYKPGRQQRQLKQWFCKSGSAVLRVSVESVKNNDLFFLS